MNKGEMIREMAEVKELSFAEADRRINTVLGMIKDKLLNGESVNIVGFGKFSVKEMSERNGVNPKTGEPITISARKRISFQTSWPLKQKLNNK